MALSEQVLGGFKTGMTRSSRRGGKDGAQKLYTLQNGYVNDQGDVVPRPGLRHVASVAHSVGLYGTGGKLHVFYGDTDDFADPGNPLVEGHLLQYPLSGFILGGDIPNGTKGDVVSGRYTQNGGTVPVTYQVISGALPTGVTLDTDGTYRGQLGAAGTFSWIVRATDANGEVADLTDGNVVTTVNVNMVGQSTNATPASYITSRGDWHMVMLDQDVIAGTNLLYVDGVLRSSQNMPAIASPRAYDFSVGSSTYSDPALNGLLGYLAGAGVIDGGITAAEAAFLYNLGTMIPFAQLASSADPRAVSLWSRMYFAWQLDELPTQSTFVDQKGHKDLSRVGTVGSFVDARMGRVASFNRTGYLRAVGAYGPTSWHRTLFAWVNSSMVHGSGHQDMVMGNYDSVQEGKAIFVQDTP